MLMLLGGCSFAKPASEDLAGLGAGIVVGGITANPWIGVAAGVGARFAAGSAIGAAERDIETTIREQYRVAVVGRIEGVKEAFYAISPERRLQHPAAAAIRENAREDVFAAT